MWRVADRNVLRCGLKGSSAQRRRVTQLSRGSRTDCVAMTTVYLLSADGAWLWSPPSRLRITGPSG
eukprot:6719677-Prymnesium_polylepis.1